MSASVIIPFQVAVYIYKVGDSRTKVEVISKRVSELDGITGAKDEYYIFGYDIGKNLSGANKSKAKGYTRND